MKCLWLTQTAYRTATPPWCNPSGTHEYLAQHTIDPSLHQISEEAPVITCHHLCKIMQNSSYYSFISSISVTVPRWSADICRQDTLELSEPRSCIQTNRTDLGLLGLLRSPQRLEYQLQIPQIPDDLLAAHLGKRKHLQHLVRHLWGGAPWCPMVLRGENKTLLHGSIWIHMDLRSIFDMGQPSDAVSLSVDGIE